MSHQTVTAPTVESDDIHTFADDSFTDRNVCLVTGAATGIGLTVAGYRRRRERPRGNDRPRY